MRHDGTPERIGTKTEGAAMSAKQESKNHGKTALRHYRFFVSRAFRLVRFFFAKNDFLRVGKFSRTGSLLWD
jgi:hypothetical protein